MGQSFEFVINQITGDFYEVTFSSPEIKTVYDYLYWPNSPAYSPAYLTESGYGNPEDFLAVADRNGVTNRDRIEAQYKTHADKKLKGGDTKTLIIKVGTRLIIPVEKINRSGLLQQGVEVKPLDEGAFRAKQLADLEADVNYKASFKEISFDSTSDGVPSCTVWIWCKALSDDNTGELQGKVFNITPFIQRVSTNVTKNGGNFQIALSPIVAAQDASGEWSIQPNSTITLANGNELGYNKEVVSNASLINADGSEAKFLFHHMITTNDLVFIRFETLQKEESQRIVDQDKMEVDKFDLPNRIYDMIGLIDSNRLDVNASLNVNINLSGRDLSKLFLDDGCYFYALELAQGRLNFAGGAQANNSLLNRLAGTGALQYLNTYFNTAIPEIFQFIINQLSHIKIAPDNLFLGWGERRNKRFTKDAIEGDAETPVAQVLADKEDKSIDLIGELRKDSTENLPTEYKKRREIYNELTRFLIETKKYGGTRSLDPVSFNYVYKGWSAFRFRNERGILEDIEPNGYPTYLREQLGESISPELIANVSENNEIQNSVSAFREQGEKEIMPGIWSIIKLAFDDQVTFRKVVDASLSSANGALLNFLRKACQEPFVELLMDTYGDEYVLTVRKPPTDRSSYEKLLQGLCVTDDGEVTPTLIVDIDNQDVEGKDLDFDDSSIYSWYHFTPRQCLLGSASQFTLQYLPAILLPEYSDIWGSRPLQIDHNYINFIPTDIQQQNNKLSLDERQAYLDYKYLIESNSYNPFTRKGTIVLAKTDRRLKMGGFIRYNGEIFHIEAVSHSHSITNQSLNSTTTIVVNRGMVEKYITGVYSDELKRNISYFDIVKCEVDFNKTKQQPKTKKVNKTVTKTITETTPIAQATSVSGAIENPKQPTHLQKMVFLAQSQGFTVTSQTTGQHNTGSKHYRGLAIDVRSKDHTNAQCLEFMAFMRAAGYRVRDERVRPKGQAIWGGPHIHVEVKDEDIKKSPDNIPQQKSTTTTRTVSQVITEEVADGFETVADREKILTVEVQKDVFNFFLKQKQFLL